MYDSINRIKTIQKKISLIEIIIDEFEDFYFLFLVPCFSHTPKLELGSERSKQK